MSSHSSGPSSEFPTEFRPHSYHLVNPSPWPLVAAFCLLGMTLGGAALMHKHQWGLFTLIPGFATLLYIMYAWWRDVVHEGMVEKSHTTPVSMGLRIGMALFIISEVMFFFAFFWSFFHASTSPHLPLAETWGMGRGTWPPKGIEAFDPFHLPFLNTLILLLSGTTVTWAHYAVMTGNQRDTVRALAITVGLGALFTLLQAYEYSHAAFGFKDGIYASNFYMATGFHGFHVFIGTVFLAVCLMRAKRGDFAPGKQHLGFEFAAWYWHFVDVVWLFLFVFVYLEFGNKILTAFGMLPRRRCVTMRYSALLRSRCPVCGKGKLFRTWLTLNDVCACCGLPISENEVGDGPAFFAITFTGTVIAISAVIVDLRYAPSLWVHAGLWLTATIVLSLLSLRFFKTALLFAHFAYRTEK